MMSQIRSMLCEDTAGFYEHAARAPISDDMDEKWPEDVEDAFLEAVEYLKNVGRRKFSINGKLCDMPEVLNVAGRNELISRYVFIKTRKYRSRKQVSSHIQVWKNSKKPPCRTGKNGPMDAVKFAYFQALMQENHTATHCRRSPSQSPPQTASLTLSESSFCSTSTDAPAAYPQRDKPDLSVAVHDWASLQYPLGMAPPMLGAFDDFSAPTSPTVVSPTDSEHAAATAAVGVWPNYFGLYVEDSSDSNTIQKTIARMREVHATEYPSVGRFTLSPHAQVAHSMVSTSLTCPTALMRVRLDLDGIALGSFSNACIVETADGRPLQCITTVVSFNRQVYTYGEAKAAVQLNNQHVYHFDMVPQFLVAYLGGIKLLPNQAAVANSLQNFTIVQTFSGLMAEQPLLEIVYEFEVGDGTVEPFWLLNESYHGLMGLGNPVPNPMHPLNLAPNNLATKV
ncbi:hypothetical protein H4R34_001772 [Dimargaris verticillata]|uniref:TEA domain-containing protein n=1 Tax=Dimargaris verticillata TaxID=2761393 RepID=A0A9W8B2Z7_9FUNG|nr:hypothetical protein H4R34_001772 [Dimargaris verticillata]